MYDAVCDNCGQNTQVPFLPRQDRPVYCSDCFSKMKPARSGGSW
jgi:CxxC-x17-CxxC domain-containing protein